LADDVVTLFDEYALRWARGESPDAREYLARAGPAADELAELLDRFLAGAPLREADPELVADFAAWAAGEPPLLALRVRRGVRRDEVVAAIVDRFRLPAAKRPKVERYLHRLETGLLDPRGVDRGVLEAYAGVLRAHIEDLLAWRPPPIRRAGVAYLRAPEAINSGVALSAPSEPEERDEVDELFTGAR
jgi:hypothetical protein